MAGLKKTTKTRVAIGGSPTKVLPKSARIKLISNCVIIVSQSSLTVRKPIHYSILTAQNRLTMRLDKEWLLKGRNRFAFHKGTYCGNPLSEGWTYPQVPVMHFCTRQRQGHTMTSSGKRTYAHSLTH